MWKASLMMPSRPRLKKAIAEACSPFFGRTLDPDKEVTITTGANEGRSHRFRALLRPIHLQH